MLWASLFISMTRNWKLSNDNEEQGGDEPKIFTIEKSVESFLPPQNSNKIYFYSDVTKDSVLGLFRQIDDVTRQLKICQFTYNLPKPPAIELHIHSDGGDIFAGLSAIDKITDNPVPIETYCEGIVASAATFISLAGCKRYITKNSFMLIHQLRSGMWGNYAQFKDEVENLDLLMILIKNVYAKTTKIDADELGNLLTHDLILDASRCLDYGLVDKVL